MIRAFTQLSYKYQEYLTPLESESLLPLDVLEAEVHEYLAELDEASSSYEFLDISTASRVGEICLELLKTIGSNPSKANHRVVQMAIRYFILDDDAEGDATSIIGFDDDEEVALAAKSFITNQ